MQFIISFLLILLTCYANTLTADTVCGDWETYKDEKCLMLVKSAQNYDEAINTCKHYNSSLVIITSREEQNFISNFLYTTHKIIENVWTGLKYVNNKYKWSDESEANYTNWAEGSPKNNTEMCVQIDSYDLSLGKWSDISCLKVNYALCEKLTTNQIYLIRLKQLEVAIEQQNATIVALNNANKMQNSTINELMNTINKLEKNQTSCDNQYSIFIENNKIKKFIYPKRQFSRVIFSDAIEICHQNNGTLVEIDSPDKQKLVELYLSHLIPNDVYYWIGAYKDLNSGKYKWYDSGNELQYANWLPGYPNLITTNANIQIEDKSPSFGKWFSAGSNNTINLFCEIVI